MERRQVPLARDTGRHVVRLLPVLARAACSVAATAAVAACSALSTHYQAHYIWCPQVANTAVVSG